MKASTPCSIVFTLLIPLIIFSSCDDDTPELKVNDEFSITSFSADDGYPGDSIFIIGENLSRINSITVNGTELQIVKRSNEEIAFIIADDTNSGTLVVNIEDNAPVEKFIRVYDPNWLNVSVGLEPSTSLWSHDFVDLENGFFSYGYEVYITRNGGKSWQTVLKDVNLNPIQAVDEQTLWIHQDSWNAIKTVDGGNSWTDVKFLDGFISDKIQFSSALTGWVIGKHKGFVTSGILKTIDGGVTWTESHKIEKRVFEYNITEILSLSENIILIPDLENKIIFKTLDGGETWEEISMEFYLPLFSLSSAIHFLNPDQAWLYSYGLFKSNNGGKNWEPVDISVTLGTEEIIDIHFFNNLEGILLGCKGTILKTRDGGESWHLRYAEAGFFSADHIDESKTTIARTYDRIIRSDF